MHLHIFTKINYICLHLFTGRQIKQVLQKGFFFSRPELKYTLMFSLPKTKIEVVVGKAGKREEFISLLVELCTANTNPRFPLMEKLHFQSSSRAWAPTRKEKLDPLNKGIQRTLRKHFHDWKELFEGAGFIRGMYCTQLLYPGCFHDADYANEGMEHRWCQIRGKKKKKIMPLVPTGFTGPTRFLIIFRLN